MDRIPQGITKSSHRRTETEDQRIQDSHSQPHARFSACFLRGAHEYRPVAAGTRRPQAAAAVSPRWRRPKQFSRPRGCICAARSFYLTQIAELPVRTLIGTWDDSARVYSMGYFAKLVLKAIQKKKR